MFEQVKLSYSFDALEPHVDTLTMETHYGKHHATYTKNFNDAVEKAGITGKTAAQILAELDEVKDEAVRKALRNNGGGYYNHNLYFDTLSPAPAKTPSGKLLDKINEKFGGLDPLKEELTKLALGQFGSGWAWLSANKDGDLKVSASPNQDNPISEGTEYVPIIALDVWEHAYYLKYKNMRGNYIKSFFEILDWNRVSELYNEVTGN